MNTAVSTSNAYTDTKLSDKVDKVSGKGLSTNDFTDTDKAAIASNTSAISAETTRASNAETALSDRVTDNATALSGKVALVSTTTQVVDSNIAIKNGKKILLEKKDGTQANGIFANDYGTYEKIEVGTQIDPLTLNHSAKAPDGTTIGKNIQVNYKDVDGNNKSDAIAYMSDLASAGSIQVTFDDTPDWVN
jgi:hypothetical protein